MIERWFSAKGEIDRGRFVRDSLTGWFLGHAGLIGIFLATTPVYSFTALGRFMDHAPEYLDGMAHGFGSGPVSLVLGYAFVLVAVALWAAQIWSLAALASKRLHDLGRGGWLAGLVLVPTLGAFFWLYLATASSRRSPVGVIGESSPA